MKTQIAVLAFAGLCLGGCAKDIQPPLIFVQSTSFGVVASAGTSSQGGELTLGFHNNDVAIIPVVTSGGEKIYSTHSVTGTCAAGQTCDPTGDKDALSVLGQFDSSTSGGSAAAASVGLGTFFATGLAATNLADGFKAKLSK